MHRAPFMLVCGVFYGVFCGAAWSADADEKPAPATTPIELKWRPLFDGKDFTGWKEPADNRWWTIRDGVLHVQSDPQKKGSTLWTDRDYADFEMEFEFRMGDGTVDSGVFVRCEHEQIQIGISGSLKRDMTASPYIAGKGYPVEAQGVKELLKPRKWNKMRIRAKGNAYTVWLNGKQVMEYASDTAVAKGPLGIQLHPGVEMAIDYRKVRIAEL